MSTAYDPRAHTWNSWAALMCEAYGAQNLEIPSSEDEWKGWASGFSGIDLFTKDGVPNPYAFDDWREWAYAVMNTLSVAGR